MSLCRAGSSHQHTRRTVHPAPPQLFRYYCIDRCCLSPFTTDEDNWRQFATVFFGIWYLESCRLVETMFSTITDSYQGIMEHICFRHHKISFECNFCKMYWCKKSEFFDHHQNFHSTMPAGDVDAFMLPNMSPSELRDVFEYVSLLQKSDNEEKT